MKKTNSRINLLFSDLDKKTLFCHLLYRSLYILLIALSFVACSSGGSSGGSSVGDNGEVNGGEVMEEVAEEITEEITEEVAEEITEEVAEEIAEEVSVTPVSRFSNAEIVELGEDMSGTLEPNGTIDYQIRNVPIGDFSFETTGDIDTLCFLFNSNDVTLDEDDNSGTDDNCRIRYPITTSGTYYIVIESKSASTGNFTLKTNIFDSDLEISITLARITDDYTEDTIRLSATVHNLGPGSAVSSTLKYYRSTDNIISPSDEVIANNIIGELPAGENIVSPHTFKAPRVFGVMPITYYYGACIEQIRDLDVNNNCSVARSVTIIPELEITQFSTTLNFALQQGDITLSASIRNNNRGVNKTILAYYQSQDDIISLRDKEIATGDIENFLSGSTRDVSETFNTPPASNIEKYYYGVCIVEVEGVTFSEDFCSNAIPIIIFPTSFTHVGNTIDDTGDLNLDGAVSVTTAQVEDNNYLFVAGRDDDGVSVFLVTASGDLIPSYNIDDTGDLNLDGAISVVTTKIGTSTYLFVAGFDDNGVSVFEVTTDGILIPSYNIDDTGDLNLEGANSITVSRAGLESSTYLFVASASEDGVSVFEVTTDGILISVFNTSLESSEILSIIADEVYGTIYLFAAYDNKVSVFEVSTNGSFTKVYDVSDDDELYLTGRKSITTAQLRGSTYLFVASASEDGVSIFTVAANGNLSNFANISNVELEMILPGVARIVSASTTQGIEGGYLFITGVVEDGVSVYRVEPGNHSFANALDITLGSNYSGFLDGTNPFTSEDWYRIFLPAGKVSLGTTGSLNTVCEFYDSRNVLLPPDDDDSGPGDNCKIIDIISNEGSYYLRIVGSSASDMGPYGLESYLCDNSNSPGSSRPCVPED